MKSPIQLLFLVLIAVLATTPKTVWAQGPENVLVVVNEDSPNSLALANHYVMLRDIPVTNVVYLSNIRTNPDSKLEDIDSKHYRSDIFEPIQAAIQERGLAQQIECIAYSADFPTRVLAKPETDKYLKASGKKYNKHFHPHFISLNSATYFGADFFAVTPTFLDEHSNWFAQKSSSPTRAFSSQVFWRKDGTPTDDAAQGRRYMLSTVLAVVRTGRPSTSSLEKALVQIERSANADGTRPAGEYYFADNPDPRSRTRKSQFPIAAAALRKLGYEVEIGPDAIPKNKLINGVTLGVANVKWPVGKSKFAPGAFCDNFTSFGAWWGRGQTKVTHFLDNGAAAATGTVYEPYTIPYKIPSAFTHVHYARGCTIAEAIYRTVLNPYQLLIVGDPICCPFGEFPKFQVDGLKTRSVVKGDIELKLESQTDGPDISHFEVFFDGRFLSRTQGEQAIRIATDDTSEGYHEVRIVAVSRSLLATRTSQKLEFWLRREGQSLKVDVDNQKVHMDKPLTITATSSSPGEIEIRQNSRVIGKISGDDQLKIDSSLLGQGKSNLQGFQIVGDKTIASVKIEIEILP